MVATIGGFSGIRLSNRWFEWMDERKGPGMEFFSVPGLFWHLEFIFGRKCIEIWPGEKYNASNEEVFFVWIDKLERKLGRFAIPHIIRYLIFGQALVYVISMFKPEFLLYINLIPSAVRAGQVWRLFTFVFAPVNSGIFFEILSLFCYYWIGDALERTWGSFKMDFYLLLGWVCVIAAIFLFGFDLTSVNTFYNQFGFVYDSMFLALAMMYPDMQVLLFYFIPIKAKYVGILSIVGVVMQFIFDSTSGRMLIFASFIPFLAFFVPEWITALKYKRRGQKYRANWNSGAGRQSRRHNGSPNQGGWFKKSPSGQHNPDYDRQQTVIIPMPRQDSAPQHNAQGAQPVNGQGPAQDRRRAFHRCEVCGITELDDPNMTFRFCSQCSGAHEYCEKHIHNHVHIK